MFVVVVVGCVVKLMPSSYCGIQNFIILHAKLMTLHGHRHNNGHNEMYNRLQKLYACVFALARPLLELILYFVQLIAANLTLSFDRLH